MNFKSVSIKNFRNFNNININLSNKNAFFGMNDVGKTNFLYALRFLFDKEIRRLNFIDTDYHKKNIKNPIEIVVTVDISDIDDDDTKKLRSKLKGAILSNQNTVFIKLKADFDQKEMVGIPILYWGGSLNELEEIKSRGTYYEIDYIFNVIYIDAYVDLYRLFKKNIKKLIMNDKDEDKAILKRIDRACNTLNKNISQLSGISDFETKINPVYKKYRNENVSVVIKSEIAINGLYSNVVPYIKQNNDDYLYPTSGEGRKKLLVYSIYDLLAHDEEKLKINLFLIEEPENHLHRSLQIALSYELFHNNGYKYLFMTTHSPYILTEMDCLNLVRIYSEKTIVSDSYLYNVPENFQTQRKTLNEGLAEAIFSNRVLLVEGPSEKALFEKILSVVNPYYEADGVFILPVLGIGFKKYYDILKALNIFCVLKTDNDLRSNGDRGYSAIGFSRINNYIPIKKDRLPKSKTYNNSFKDKRELYDKYRDKLDIIREKYNIYLSRCSLEEDLDEVIHDEMTAYLPVDNEAVVEYLQDAKNVHMVELVTKLTIEDCIKIYSHYNFKCLKEVMNEC